MWTERCIFCQVHFQNQFCIWALELGRWFVSVSTKLWRVCKLRTFVHGQKGWRNILTVSSQIYIALCSLLRQEYYPISPFLELHQSDKVHLNWNKPQSNIVCAGLGISIVQIICQLQFENISTTLWILRNVRVWAVRGPGVIKASNMPAMIRTIRILLFLTISGIREGEREKHFYQLRYF